MLQWKFVKRFICEYLTMYPDIYEDTDELMSIWSFECPLSLHDIQENYALDRITDNIKILQDFSNKARDNLYMWHCKEKLNNEAMCW